MRSVAFILKKTRVEFGVNPMNSCSVFGSFWRKEPLMKLDRRILGAPLDRNLQQSGFSAGRRPRTLINARLLDRDRVTAGPLEMRSVGHCINTPWILSVNSARRCPIDAGVQRRSCSSGSLGVLGMISERRRLDLHCDRALASCLPLG